MLKTSRNHPPSYRDHKVLNPNENDEKSESTLLIRDTSDKKIHVLPQSANKKVINIINGYNGSTMIHLADDSMMIYGYNAHGQLGLNHFDYVNHTEIPKWCKSMKIKKIFSGISSKHSFLITNDNKMYAVGNNLFHQFGMKTEANTLSKWTEITHSFPSKIESIKNIATSSKFTTFLMENGEIYQTMYQYPHIQLIQSDIRFKKIASGKSHVLLVSQEDDLYAFGLNNYGQIGINGIEQSKLPLKVTLFDKMVIKIDIIACGQDHSIVLTKQNKVYCFGRNDYYQIGNGSNDTNIINIPQNNDRLEDIHQRIIDIKCGAHHSMIMTENGEYYLWGRNKENQCLIKSDNDNNTEFIKIPRKYQYDKQDMDIINIYLGYKETKIVSKQRFEQTNGEILNQHNISSRSEKLNDRNSGNKKGNNFRVKLNKFKTWYNKLKGDKKKKKKQRENNNDNTNKINQLENIQGLNEYKYVNHQLVICDDNNNNQWYYSSNNNSSSKFSSRLDSIDEIPEIESNDIDSSLSAGNYAEICYYSPKADEFTNTVKVDSNANDILYHPMTFKEC